MVKRCGLLLWLVLCATAPAWGRGWEPLGYTLRMNAFGTSNAFPGSPLVAPDNGIEPRGALSSGLRVSKALKLGVVVSAGGNVQRVYTRGDYGWLGLGTLLRRHATTLTADGEWTPKRNKFPTNLDEGGEYAETKLTLGLRQNLGSRTRLRMDGTLDRDKYVHTLSERDVHGRELFASVNVSCAPGIELRAETSVGRDVANASRYDINAHWAGAGVVRSDSLWRSDLSVRSGVRSYPHNIPGASNYRRRDQSIEIRLRVTRALGPGLSAVAGASLADKTSTRDDLKFTARTFTLGFEWTGGGK